MPLFFKIIIFQLRHVAFTQISQLLRPTPISSQLTLSRGISVGVPGRESNPGLPCRTAGRRTTILATSHPNGATSHVALPTCFSWSRSHVYEEAAHVKASVFVVAGGGLDGRPELEFLNNLWGQGTEQE
jgi:hypothetical protein